MIQSKLPNTQYWGVLPIPIANTYTDYTVCQLHLIIWRLHVMA